MVTYIVFFSITFVLQGLTKLIMPVFGILFVCFCHRNSSPVILLYFLKIGTFELIVKQGKHASELPDKVTLLKLPQDWVFIPL